MIFPENYPDYKITSSACQQIRDMDGVNACCQPNCQRRGDHYSAIGKYQIELCTIARSILGIVADNIIREYSCVSLWVMISIC